MSTIERLPSEILELPAFHLVNRDIASLRLCSRVLCLATSRPFEQSHTSLPVGLNTSGCYKLVSLCRSPKIAKIAPVVREVQVHFGTAEEGGSTMDKRFDRYWLRHCFAMFTNCTAIVFKSSKADSKSLAVASKGLKKRFWEVLLAAYASGMPLNRLEVAGVPLAVPAIDDFKILYLQLDGHNIRSNITTLRLEIRCESSERVISHRADQFFSSFSSLTDLAIFCHWEDESREFVFLDSVSRVKGLRTLELEIHAFPTATSFMATVENNRDTLTSIKLSTFDHDATRWGWPLVTGFLNLIKSMKQLERVDIRGAVRRKTDGCARPGVRYQSIDMLVTDFDQVTRVFDDLEQRIEKKNEV